MFNIINYKLFKMNKFLALLLLFPVISIAQWKGNSDGDNQKSNMIKYYMESYVNQDYGQLERIIANDATIRYNEIEMNKNSLKDAEMGHHSLYSDISFNTWAVITSEYENGNVWTHLWGEWTGTGNFTKSKKTNLVHLAYKWNGNNQVENIVGFYDATHLNNEIAASSKKKK